MREKKNEKGTRVREGEGEAQSGCLARDTNKLQQTGSRDQDQEQQVGMAWERKGEEPWTEKEASPGKPGMKSDWRKVQKTEGETLQGRPGGPESDGRRKVDARWTLIPTHYHSSPDPCLWMHEVGADPYPEVHAAAPGRQRRLLTISGRS